MIIGKTSSAFVDLISKQETAREYKKAHTRAEHILPRNAYALQRRNVENLKQIFPGKEYRGLSPNCHIHVSVSELYIPTLGLPFLLEKICGPILGIYKSLTDT
jgi:hypothetical protein